MFGDCGGLVAGDVGALVSGRMCAAAGCIYPIRQ